MPQMKPLLWTMSVSLLLMLILTVINSHKKMEMTTKKSMKMSKSQMPMKW